jgi:hypothetical protein
MLLVIVTSPAALPNIISFLPGDKGFKKIQ